MAGSGERVASKGHDRVRANAKGCNSPSVQVRAGDARPALLTRPNQPNFTKSARDPE
jgi:hypothetical protein